MDDTACAVEAFIVDGAKTGASGRMLLKCARRATCSVGGGYVDGWMSAKSNAKCEKPDCEGYVSVFESGAADPGSP